MDDGKNACAGISRVRTTAVPPALVTAPVRPPPRLSQLQSHRAPPTTCSAKRVAVDGGIATVPTTARYIFERHPHTHRPHWHHAVRLQLQCERQPDLSPTQKDQHPSTQTSPIESSATLSLALLATPTEHPHVICWQTSLNTANSAPRLNSSAASSTPPPVTPTEKNQTHPRRQKIR